MQPIGISTNANEACPTLAAWLAGAGLLTAAIDPAAPAAKGAVRILAEADRAHARHSDILITVAEGAPALVRAAKGQPATIRFGRADLAFGHALVAELVRPADRPASGEPASADLLRLAARIAQSDATVLLQGETGTGKEGMSRFVHAASPRAGGPFVAVNCAALPETMLEAMLFGHQKGSFTGAGAAAEGLFRAAEGGTLFLDEVAELPLALQAKLLRAIQEREVLPVGATRPIAVDVRIVAAANRDLAAEVEAGRFRADLYWRLAVMTLQLQPLSQRRQDVRAIAAALLLRHTPAGDAFAWPTAAALDALMAHRWPGNVRELDNVLQRALLLRAGDRIDADDLALTATPTPFVPSPSTACKAGAQDKLQPTAEVEAPATMSLDFARDERKVVKLHEAARSSEFAAIEEALAATGGHRLRAAQRLGISERTLRYRLAGMRAAA